jgi:hypothetical protein
MPEAVPCNVTSPWPILSSVSTKPVFASGLARLIALLIAAAYEARAIGGL